MRTLLSIITLGALPLICMAQFHTVKMPIASIKVVETQRLGITDITIDYHSPAVRARPVWDVVVPFDNQPIAWRAGANMNTTIEFTTDVVIEGQPLKKGKYGFHVIPRTDASWTLLFAHENNQWGSYYLDQEKDITLQVEVDPASANYSEQLDYEFVNRTDSSVVIALEWEEKRIPFTVSVDLKRTVIDNFRYELQGINTYQWEAWNDAARWCYEQNTNLEEALTWVDRSINGGFGGFASNKNFSNLSTKARIHMALGQSDLLKTTINDMDDYLDDPREIYYFGLFLIENKQVSLSIDLFNKALFSLGNDNWVMQLGLGKALLSAKESQPGMEALNKALEFAPERSKNFVQSVIDGSN